MTPTLTPDNEGRAGGYLGESLVVRASRLHIPVLNGQYWSYPEASAAINNITTRMSHAMDHVRCIDWAPSRKGPAPGPERVAEN